MLMLLAWIVTFAVASLMSAKCAFMFPAVACDTPGSWHQSYGETRGIVWALFVIFVVALLPVALLYVVIFVVAFIASLSSMMAIVGLGDGVTKSGHGTGDHVDVAIDGFHRRLCHCRSEVTCCHSSSQPPRARAPIRSASSAVCRVLQRFSREAFRSGRRMPFVTVLR